MTPSTVYLNALGIVCSLGNSIATVKQKLVSGKSSLSISDAFGSEHSSPSGLYQGELPDVSLSDKKWHSRNNQFALAALNQIRAQAVDAIKRFGPDRIGVIIGTSTSGIAESESAVRYWVQHGQSPSNYDYSLQEMGAAAQYIGTILGIEGPTYGVSTACSSGAKALAAARRLIASGICDAVVAGGVDTFCRLTLSGFSSLEAVSDSLCNPFSKNRNGINIGEGAALFLVTADAVGVELSGVGESSDAHHISAPDPSGAGAKKCMTKALRDGNTTASEIDYVNLHGTATVLNDSMESLAIEEVFGLDTLCSSTKPFTGHTLGAAGAVEAGICWMMLESHDDAWLPRHIWDGVRDPDLPSINLVSPEVKLREPLQQILSNTFAFGGNNISLLLRRIQ